MHVALEKVAETIKGYLKMFFEQVVYEVLISLMSTAFDAVKQAISGSGDFTKELLAGVVEQIRTWFGKMMENFPEILEAVREVISTVAIDLWKNYVEAIMFVKKNAI